MKKFKYGDVVKVKDEFYRNPPRAVVVGKESTNKYTVKFYISNELNGENLIFNSYTENELMKVGKNV